MSDVTLADLDRRYDHDDPLAWQRDERQAARSAQEHRPHPADCTCGCRYVPGDER